MSQLLINKNTQRPSKMTVGIVPLAGDLLGASFHEATPGTVLRERLRRTVFIYAPSSRARDGGPVHGTRG
jgi:hypothetical protein